MSIHADMSVCVCVSSHSPGRLLLMKCKLKTFNSWLVDYQLKQRFHLNLSLTHQFVGLYTHFFHLFSKYFVKENYQYNVH